MSLARAVAALREHHGAPEPPPSTDPFELVVWENVAYLASPARRRQAFDLLKRTIGTDPKQLIAARDEAIERVTSRGILKTTFAARLRECARIALEEFSGDLAAALRGPAKAARRALRSFPGIGEPGAEKILLFAGRETVLAPESNGLRVLVRLGLIREEKSYARTYAAGREAAAGLPAEPLVLQEAHLLLQHHGRTVCRRSAPLCARCPLAGACAHAVGQRRGEGRRRHT